MIGSRWRSGPPADGSGDGEGGGAIGSPQPEFKGYDGLDLDPNHVMNESLGLPAGMRLPTGGILDIFGIGVGPGCVLGVCNIGIFNATNANTNADLWCGLDPIGCDLNAQMAQTMAFFRMFNHTPSNAGKGMKFTPSPLSCGPYGCTPSSDVYNKQNACRGLAIVAVPLAIDGVLPEQVAVFSAKVLSWLGVGSAVAGPWMHGLIGGAAE